MTAHRTLTRTCPLCEATCGLTITIDDDARDSADQVVAVAGDPDDVFSRGFICPKGAALGALHADPDRLRAPLMKRGGRHVPVSWEDAFAAVAEGLEGLWSRHDRTALAVYLGNPTVHNLAGTLYAKPLLLSLRTHQIYSASTVDQMPKHVSAGLMYGDPLSIPVPDVDRCDWMLLLGANPWVSNGSLCTAPDFPGRLRALQQRGGRFVVVDPRRSETARRADQHIAIRPGGDAFLLAAMAHVLFADGLVDLGRLGPHVAGVEALRQVVAPLSPGAVADRCGVSAEAVATLAHDFAAADKPAIYGRIGTCTQRFGTVASWLVDALMVLRGRLDADGGAMFPRPAHSRHRPGKQPGGRGFGIGRWKSRVRGLPEVRSELPVATLAEEIATPGRGQVRGMLTIAGNPVLSTPNGARLDAALADLEFMVSVDPYLNETTRHADVILPPPSPLYRSAYHLAFYDFAVRNVAHYAAPVLPLPDDQRSEDEILLRLTAIAQGLGAGADPWAVDDAIAKRAVADETRAQDGPIAGRDGAEILASMSAPRGVDRLLELKIRCGPYGDHFGARADGHTLETLAGAEHGVDFGALTPRLPQRLKTPSGKVELCPPSCAADVDNMVAELAAADTGGLVLIGRRALRSNNSWMHNLPKLVAGKGRCTLHIHPDDAAAHGVADGGRARVTSRVGEVTIEVTVTDTIRQGVVSIPHGWGHGLDGAQLAVAAAHAGVNVNLLTDEAQLDPLSGNAVLCGVPVQLDPA